MNKRNIIVSIPMLLSGFLFLPLFVNAQSMENHYVNLTVISQRAEGSAAQEWNNIYYSIDQIVGAGSNSFLSFVADSGELEWSY
ncbi:MAG: hypothetical protein WA093_02180 [Minisyncoccales bacterium]